MVSTIKYAEKSERLSTWKRFLDSDRKKAKTDYQEIYMWKDGSEIKRLKKKLACPCN